MAKVKITMTGVPEKEPKLHENGNIDLVFKVEPSTAIPKGLEPLKECLCLVHVAPKTWKKVAGKVQPERKLLVTGEVKASVNKRGVPFLEMVAMDIGIIERGEKEEENREGEAEAQPKAPPQATKRKLKLGTPKGTVKVVALSSIHLPEDVTPLDPEKIKEVVEFVQAQKTFPEPIILGKEKNVLVDGYEWYVAAKELNIERVPSHITNLRRQRAG